MNNNRALNRSILRMVNREKNLRNSAYKIKAQRRYPAVDMFGFKHYAFGSASVPADIGISITKDLVKFERFEFKLTISDIKSQTSSSNSIQRTVVSIGPTEIANDRGVVINDPHSHQSVPHSHTMEYAPTIISSVINNFKVYIEGVDFTPMFATQHGSWITGNGTYPSEDTGINYDIMEACNYVTTAQRKRILSSGMKHIQIVNDGIFNVELTLYLKYTHINR